MKYQGCLLAVKDISAAKNFYETVLHQTAVMDIGEHVAFEGFSLQQGYAEIVGIASDSLKEQSHNFQLYFEVEDTDCVCAEAEMYTQFAGYMKSGNILGDSATFGYMTRINILWKSQRI